ncbi:LppU/SCO3897 family protein [Streptomyces sp. NPDC057540]|uniref:LppU/SCO3897 family protein n=1 Tax=Streptomyces sp. NPDC057540 TaxID=3346160 RepID=UPI00368980F3
MTTPPAPFSPEQQQPAAPAKKGGALLKKVGGVVVAIVVALAVKLGLPYLTGDAPVHAKAGECVTVTGPDNDPKVDTVDCSSGKPDLFKVVKVIDDTFDVNKCGEQLSALAQQLDSDKFVLCMEEVAAK